MSLPVEIKNIAGSILQTNQQSLTNCINAQLNKLSVADSVLDGCIASNKVAVNVANTSAIAVADSVLDRCVADNKVAVNVANTSAIAVADRVLDGCIASNKVAVNVANTSAIAVADSVLNGCIASNKVAVNVANTSAIAVADSVLNGCVDTNKVAVVLKSIDGTLTSSGGLNVVINGAPITLSVADSVLDGCVSSNKVAVTIAGQNQEPLIVKTNSVSAVSLYDFNTTSEIISNNSLGGVLSGIWIGSLGAIAGARNFIKLYDGTSATYNNTPLAIFPISSLSYSNYIDTKNLAFSNGLCVRASSQFTESSDAAPTGTPFITALLYNNQVTVNFTPVTPMLPVIPK